MRDGFEALGLPEIELAVGLGGAHRGASEVGTSRRRPEGSVAYVLGIPAMDCNMPSPDLVHAGKSMRNAVPALPLC